MPAIGTVTKAQDGSFKGQLKTLSIKADMLSQPNDRKTSAAQPDYRVFSGDVEIGAGWMRRSGASGRDYVSLSPSALPNSALAGFMRTLVAPRALKRTHSPSSGTRPTE